MRYRWSRLMIAGFVAVAGWGQADAALAQQTRSVTIENGSVSVDGRRLPSESVPEPLRQFEGRVAFSYTGDEEPLIGFGNRVFRVEDDRIVEVESSPFAFSFPGEAYGHAMALRLDVDSLRRQSEDALVRSLQGFQFDIPRLEFDGERLIRFSDSLRAMIPRVEFDREQMERSLNELRSSLGTLKHGPLPDADIRFQGRMPRAHVFRPLDVEGYLDEIREIDRGLYEQLLSERELEDESLELARSIQEAESAAEREVLVEELRAHLENVFEVRQENRRDEIRKLENRIESLRRRLETRESVRDQVIQNRLDELTEE